MVMGVLSEAEKKVLEIVSQRKLITKQEVNSLLEPHGFTSKDVNLSRLAENGFMQLVEGMGTVLIATKKGQDYLKEQDF